MQKLQLGCGVSIKKGWINTDGFPEDIRTEEIRKQVSKLDVTERFIATHNSFDYIYSEHMIEHITYDEGIFMLKECFQLLKPKGVLRIATPDILKIIGLYINTPDTEEYIKFITDKFLDTDEYSANKVVNNAFRAWGHKFLYDINTLINSGKIAGFSSSCICKYGVSAHKELRNLEVHGKNIKNENVAIYETMIVEFTK